MTLPATFSPKHIAAGCRTPADAAQRFAEFYLNADQHDQSNEVKKEALLAAIALALVAIAQTTNERNT